jgi:hypothetical protein
MGQQAPRLEGGTLTPYRDLSRTDREDDHGEESEVEDEGEEGQKGEKSEEISEQSEAHGGQEGRREKVCRKEVRRQGAQAGCRKAQGRAKAGRAKAGRAKASGGGSSKADAGAKADAGTSARSQARARSRAGRSRRSPAGSAAATPEHAFWCQQPHIVAESLRGWRSHWRRRQLLEQALSFRHLRPGLSAERDAFRKPTSSPAYARAGFRIVSRPGCQARPRTSVPAFPKPGRQSGLSAGASALAGNQGWRALLPEAPLSSRVQGVTFFNATTGLEFLPARIRSVASLGVAVSKVAPRRPGAGLLRGPSAVPRGARPRPSFRFAESGPGRSAVLILQHKKSFDCERAKSHKNAATGHGFRLPVFLKMFLVFERGTRATTDGDWSASAFITPNEGRSVERG